MKLERKLILAPIVGANILGIFSIVSYMMALLGWGPHWVIDRNTATHIFLPVTVICAACLLTDGILALNSAKHFISYLRHILFILTTMITFSDWFIDVAWQPGSSDPLNQLSMIFIAMSVTYLALSVIDAKLHRERSEIARLASQATALLGILAAWNIEASARSACCI